MEYRQTLSIELARAKQVLNLNSDNVFTSWLSEEYDFLSQNSEPVTEVEVLAMDYVKILKDLEKATCVPIQLMTWIFHY